MDEAQTLELQIKAKSQEAKASVDSLVKSLTNVENVLTNIYLELGSIEKKANTSTTNATSGINKIKSSSDKATSSLSNLTKGLSLSGAYLGVKRLTNQFLEWMNLSIDYTEQLNLFNVVFDNVKKDGVQTFSELGKSAIKFQNTMNERFGTNKATTLQYQSLFQSMSENLGVDDEYAYIMSESLTKLTYDWASLYNKTETEVARALKAGVLAGQTEPLRNYGSDVTQQTLTPVLENIGITDRTVKQLTQAEKQILRYIAVMQQSSVAHTDFANTVESPANQLKVFSQQLAETKVAITSLFMGTFANILPYANAFLMVIKEIARAIADMFGIEITDYNSGIASSENAFADLGDSIDGATDRVKELKRQTLGFDQINNINENKDSGSGGSSITGGIDQRLLDAIKGYDNGMEQVRMKATQIRDSIMEWLGFTKEIDPLTDEVSFKLGEGYTNIEKILDVIKLIGTTMISWKISNTVLKFFNNLAKSTFSKNFKKTAGLTILFTSLIYNSDAIKQQLENGPDLGSSIQGISSAIGIGASTYMLTKNATLSLVITAVDLSVQAVISVKNFWDTIMGAIDDYANNDGKTTWSEFWNSWWEGMEQIVLPSVGDFLNSIFVEPFDELNTIIEENGGYWESWKEGMSLIWDNVKSGASNLFDKITSPFSDLNEVIEDNGGYWENWKEGVSLIWDNIKSGASTLFSKITSPFSELNTIIEDNGGYWESWRDGMKIIIEDVAGWFDGLKSKIDEAINGVKDLWSEMTTHEESGKTGLGALWEHWKDGIGIIFGKAKGGIYSNGKWHNIPQYANGGFPAHGSMFVAGESGAEIVGHINGKTEVLNQSQIASAIYSAVASAMSQYGGGIAEINIHADEGIIVDTAVNGIQRHVNQTGTLPFTIPVN